MPVLWVNEHRNIRGEVLVFNTATTGVLLSMPRMLGERGDGRNFRKSG